MKVLSRRTVHSALPAAVVLLLIAPGAQALEYNFNARLWAGPVTTNGEGQDQVDQRYSLGLQQAVSPYLTLLGGYRYTDFRNEFGDGSRFFRTTKQPELGLLYDRANFSGRFLAYDREIRTTFEQQNLDIRSYSANLEWFPSWGPRFILQARDDRNTADSATFGRDTEYEFVEAGAIWDSTKWSLRASISADATESLLTGLNVQNEALELRGSYVDDWWNDRWFFAFDGRFRRVRQVQEIPVGQPIAQPVPLTEGLFSIDVSPEIGDLQISPALIDGDLQTPVAPPIDIGGASTFRNIGVNLGVTRPITELEITVDRPSGPGVLWEVYHSSDNLNWFRVGQAVSLWDAGFLHYRIQFPETTDRYFKAVNVSANPAQDVLVTEIRALVDAQGLESGEGTGNEYWLSLRNTFLLHERVELDLLGNAQRNISLAFGQSGRGRETYDYGGQLRFELLRTLQLRFDYRLTNYEEPQEPVLVRDQVWSGATLEWRPLQTVRVEMIATQRTESEEGETLRDQESLILRARTEILPRLDLTSSWSYNVIDDPFAGYQQVNRQWLETLSAQPYRNLRLTGRFSYTSYDSTGVVAITQRTVAGLTVFWQMFPYLNLGADGSYSTDNLQDNSTQRYSLGWTPGRKLFANITYYENRSSEGRATTTSSATLNYRMNRALTLWASANQTRTGLADLQTTETTSYRFGINVIF